MEPLAEKALHAVEKGEVTIMPERFEKVCRVIMKTSFCLQYRQCLLYLLCGYHFPQPHIFSTLQFVDSLPCSFFVWLLFMEHPLLLSISGDPKKKVLTCYLFDIYAILMYLLLFHGS